MLNIVVAAGGFNNQGIPEQLRETYPGLCSQGMPLWENGAQWVAPQYVEVPLPNGTTGQLLDVMDYISNSFMMPFIALLSTILIGWVMSPDYVIDEVRRNGEPFRRQRLYRVTIRYVAPLMMLALFLESTGILS